MKRSRGFVREHLELLVVATMVAGTAALILIVVNKLAFLNFFYIPVLIASYFLGKRQGVLAAIAAVLMVVVYATLDPDIFAPTPGEMSQLNLVLWGAFTIVTAYVVGSLYEHKSEALDELTNAYSGILEVLAKMIDATDLNSNEHSVRVAELAAETAEEMGLPDHEVENVRVAALLHDVGKIGVSVEVLRRASSHAEDGPTELRGRKRSGLLRPMGGLLSDALPLVEFERECFDGSGERGLTGDSIPLGSRIIAVADAYDSIAGDRPYGMGRISLEAFDEVERLKGSRLDPLVVEVFNRIVKAA